MNNYERVRRMAREAKTPGELADAIISAQQVADEQIDKVEKAIRADERRRVIEHIRERLDIYGRGEDAGLTRGEVDAILDDLSTPEQP